MPSRASWRHARRRPQALRVTLEGHDKRAHSAGASGADAGVSGASEKTGQSGCATHTKIRPARPSACTSIGTATRSRARRRWMDATAIRRTCVVFSLRHAATASPSIARSWPGSAMASPRPWAMSPTNGGGDIPAQLRLTWRRLSRELQAMGRRRPISARQPRACPSVPVYAGADGTHVPCAICARDTTGPPPSGKPAARAARQAPRARLSSKPHTQRQALPSTVICAVNCGTCGTLPAAACCLASSR